MEKTMSETRVIITPAEITHIEIMCEHCKHLTVFPMNPPNQAPDTPDWHKALLQCLWCRQRFPGGTKTLVLQLQKDFEMLLNNRELRLRFAIKMPGEIRIPRQE